MLPLDQALNFKKSIYMDVDDYPFQGQIQLRLSDAWNAAKEKSQHYLAAQRKQHDTKTAKITLKKGSLVLLKHMQRPGRVMKLADRFSTPYKVQEVIGSVLLVTPLNDPEAVPIRIHQRHTKIFHPRNQDLPDWNLIDNPSNSEADEVPESDPGTESDVSVEY